MPGVIDVTYNYLGHPEVVADRICQVADAVGDPTRVLAGTDCGFGTFAGCPWEIHEVHVPTSGLFHWLE